MKQVRIADLKLLSGNFEEASSMIIEQSAGCCERTAVVVHVNARNYHYLMKEPDLAATLSQRAITILDGIGLKVGIWLSGKGWHSDLNGTDLFPIVMERASQRALRVYLLGGLPGIAETAALKTQKAYPGLDVCGSHDGYFADSEEEGIVAEISSLRPHILLVGMGFPRQEHFCLRWSESAGVNLMWNVGGLFDFISGKNPRAPLLVRKARLEWLYRWFVEPVRLFRRTFFDAPLSILRIAVSGQKEGGHTTIESG
jgi:N-acetylglucosaminyldiphosphoundecaprenol N-acetyl-beta-D-mannosaminyltransferase